MEKKYKIRVNGTHEFEFTNEEIEALDARQTSSSHYHVLKNNTSFTAQVLDANFFKRQYDIKINANDYNVQISTGLDMLIEEMGLSLGSSQQVNDVKAPMPGLILEVMVKEGDEVKEGDFLLVLEAMKMENTLTAPRDGIVKSIAVKKGLTVEKNQLLIEME